MSTFKSIAFFAIATLYGCGGDDGISRELDPQYGGDPAASITWNDIDSWNAATSATESDPVFTASPSSSITTDDIETWNSAASSAETDPVFSASTASSISQTDVSRWNAAAASPESDPVFSASTASSISPADVSKWNAAASATESDPVFAASPASAISLTDVDKWNTAASAPETDPEFTASPAFAISQSDVTKWNAAATGLGTLSANTVPVWNGSTLTNSGIQQINDQIVIAADVTTSAKVKLPTADFGAHAATTTNKSCGLSGFSYTLTSGSNNACNSYCADQGLVAGVVTASGSKTAAGASCSYINDFTTCATATMSNSGNCGNASTFTCTCQKLVIDLTSEVRVTQGDMKLSQYLQLAQTMGAPENSDCDSASEYGRMKVDSDLGELWICTSIGWVAK